MADSISTINLRVDLDCHQCYKKIRKILCNLQDQERISTISYDDKSNAITIVGPFDPHNLSCKIRRKGGKVIQDIQIAGEDKPVEMAMPPLVNNGKEKPKPKPKPKEKTPVADERMPLPPALAQAPPPDRKIAATPTIPVIMVEKKPKERTTELEPAKKTSPMDFLPLTPAKKEKPREKLAPPAAKPIQPADLTPTVVEIPSWPASPVEIPSLPGLPMGRPVGPCGCPCCTPCYQGNYEGCRCCTCGKVYGYTTPQAAGCYGAAVTPYCSGYRACQLFSDENPMAACILM